MDAETKLQFKSHKDHLDRHEGYFEQIWHRLDRLPRWAVMLISTLFGLIGFLGSSLLHTILGN